MMETTEKIVEAYVRYVLNWATIPNIRCKGQLEIDLLAIDPVKLDRYHIETSVSSSSAFSRLTGLPAPNLKVLAVERNETDWIVAVEWLDHGTCPVCGLQSISRHSSYRRSLQDLSAQGKLVSVRARMTRWRCRNDRCERRIFAERLPELTAPFARRSSINRARATALAGSRSVATA